MPGASVFVRVRLVVVFVLTLERELAFCVG